MPKISRHDYCNWVTWVHMVIDEINHITKADLHGKRYLSFGFYRRKNKTKIALFEEGTIIAIGMKRIENALLILSAYYKEAFK